MTAYYNEIEPYAAQWLCNLIDARHIATGVVDTRSIEDVRPSDIAGFTQCHFFAGIGVWSYALRRAGWSDDRPGWTGSCPCQPFSTAGKGTAFDDERHLWPAWHHLIKECKPAIVFGEQVASKDAMPWLDLVQDDLEGLGYAFGAVPFPAASVGAPHIRDRLYFVANAKVAGDRGQPGILSRPAGEVQGASPRQGDGHAARADCAALCLAHTNGRDASAEREQRGGEYRLLAQSSAVNGFWADAEWIACRDGKARPVEPGTFPLAHGAPARVGRLRAYGNAINAEAARVFIKSVMECMP